MYEFRLKRTEKKNYTPLPSPICDHIAPWLDRNGVEYAILKQDEVPADVPQTCTFKGRTTVSGVAYIYAALDPEELIKAAEDIHHMHAGDI